MKKNRPAANLREFSSAQSRRQFLEDRLDLSLENLSHFSFSEQAVQGRNIENLIGAIHVPLGVAGPVQLKEDHKEYYLPLATSEGALVASVSRGCKAISLSGGAQVETVNVGVTRGPVFKTSGVKHSQQTKHWINTHFDQIAQTAQSTSSHLKLLRIDCESVGKNLYTRFVFDSSDAMGMNMATIATEKGAQLVQAATKAECISLAGNYDIDKKPAWLNFISGRGRRIWAEVVLSRETVEKVLKTTPQKMNEVVFRKCNLGSIMAGSLGFNAHFANVLAAIYLATGQDIAHVVEGSMGITTSELLENGGLYFSIYLPSLLLGAVGGGTQLPSQQESFKIMGLSKHGDMVKFAQLVGCAVLAGEISLIASQAEGSLAQAHQKHGRNSTH